MTSVFVYDMFPEFAFFAILVHGMILRTSNDNKLNIVFCWWPDLIMLTKHLHPSGWSTKVEILAHFESVVLPHHVFCFSHMIDMIRAIHCWCSRSALRTPDTRQSSGPSLVQVVNSRLWQKTLILSNAGLCFDLKLQNELHLKTTSTKCQSFCASHNIYTTVITVEFRQLLSSPSHQRALDIDICYLIYNLYRRWQRINTYHFRYSSFIAGKCHNLHHVAIWDH